MPIYTKYRMNIKADIAIKYHEETKHHPHRYAKSAGFLDWANEPDPFRRYEGAAMLSLPLTEKDPTADYNDLYERSRNTFQPFSVRNISTFLELSLGISAWKVSGGTSWALRMNPSSGNLHPTEAHLILPPLVETDDKSGVYHYNPYFHSLERRAILDARIWSAITDYFGMDGFFVALSSIYWRESWKYGERAFRYCNHDVGHAMAGLSFVGNLLGWKITYLNVLSEQDLETLLGFPKTEWHRFEREHPDLIFFVHRNSTNKIPKELPNNVVESFESLSYLGKPNRLSIDHRDWRIIDEVSAATEKPRTNDVQYRGLDHFFFEEDIPSIQAAAVIRRRRSATAFDAKTTLPKNDLFEILDRTVARYDCAPFDLGLGDTSVHLFIFIHRIADLDAGLYILVRNDGDIAELKRSFRPEFVWEGVDGAPESLGFYLLKRGNYQSEGAKAG